MKIINFIKRKALTLVSLTLCFLFVLGCLGCTPAKKDEETESESLTNAEEKTEAPTQKPTEAPTQKPTDADSDNKGEESSEPIPGVTEAKIALGEKVYDFTKSYAGVRFIGRSKGSTKGIICDHSASGIELQGYMTGEVALKVFASGDVFYTVYLDGKRVDTRFSASGGTKTLKIADFEGNYFHKIKILKQSEIGWSTSLIKELSINGYLTKAPAERDYYLEFYGDSLTSAFGNIGKPSDPSPHDTPKYQDATKSYAFLLAETIGADCSILAMSGVGLYVGGYDNPFLEYFSKYSHKRSTEMFSFEGARVPDIAIIHLGANDSTRNIEHDDFVAEAKKLVSFIRTGYQKDVPIIWAYDPSEQVPLSWLEEISSFYGGEAKGFYLIELEWRSIGAGAGGHPGVEAHEAHADLLLELIVDKKIIE